MSEKRPTIEEIAGKINDLSEKDLDLFIEFICRRINMWLFEAGVIVGILMAIAWLAFQ